MKRVFFLTVMLVSVLAWVCADRAFGHRYSTNAAITFTGSNFTGSWNASTPISGTFSVSGNRLTLNITGGPRARNTWAWTIVDANTLKDQDGDSWRKEVASLQSPVSWDVNNLSTWIEAVNGIRSGGNNREHIITVTGNISIPMSDSNTFGSVTNILVTLGGSGTISPSSNGSLLQIGNGQTVIVKDLTLQGRVVISGGTFSMQDNASVQGNDSYGGGVSVNDGIFIIQDNASVSGNNGYRGGGVDVRERGTFIMHGGEIRSNTSGSSSEGGGGGVYVYSGSFTMNNGTISGNTANAGGGGVYVANGTFIMNGGAISGNTTSGSGGGVYVSGGNFTMNGGTISDNTATNFDPGYGFGGGGVYVSSMGTFTMNGGTISGNTAINGGGVIVRGSFTSFTMQNGTISGNIANVGGGVYVSGDRYTSFTMQNGTISGNTANELGGGVYIYGSFTKTGGTIYGNDAEQNLRNTVTGQNGGGHAIYGSNNQWRSTTAGPTVNSETYGFWLND